MLFVLRATLLSFLSTSSFSVLFRPQKKKRRAASTITLMAAMTMPAMAPGVRPCFFTPLEGMGVDVASETLEGNGASGGKGWPGLSIYALPFASFCCVSIGVVALGLMAPTMP